MFNKKKIWLYSRTIIAVYEERKKYATCHKINKSLVSLLHEFYLILNLCFHHSFLLTCYLFIASTVNVAERIRICSIHQNVHYYKLYIISQV